jgi:short-subunit dehydrogenase
MAVVVITGASSGIGEATARLLAGRGHKLVLAARRIERLEKLAAELSSRTEVLVVPTDVADPAQVEALARRAGTHFGGIDVWINNAGVGHPESWWEGTPESIQRVVMINLVAPILAARAVLPWMQARGKGHIINVASVAGHIGVMGLYSATKFGLRGHTEALRRELRPYGIHVSLVSPGFIQTEMTQDLKMKMPGPELVARAIARLIDRPRREVVVPGWYRLLIWLAAHCPWLVDWAVAQQQKRQERKRQQQR